MTNSSKYFNTYVPHSNNKKIVIGDGSLTTITRVGTIKISVHFILTDMFRVPNYAQTFFQ